MKVSERLKQEAKEMLVTGIVLLVIGCIWLVLMVSLHFSKVKMNIGLAVALTPCLIFFAGSAWAFFVEYPSEKHAQQVAEGEEAREKAANQSRLSTHA